MNNLKTRGAAVYRLASGIQFAAFKFLAVTTAIFIWASFAHYFDAKFGPAVAAVMGVVAIIVMYYLIDKGLDGIIEFLADEKINPGDADAEANPRARKQFIRTVVLMAFIRLLATGTTSIWGSYEIADYVTEAPDNSAALQQMQNENATVQQTRNSLQQSLQQTRNSEAERVKKAKQDGHATVVAALAKHPRQEVRDGMRRQENWYMTTKKLKKYRDGYLVALKDSAQQVQAEAGKTAAIEASLLALNTDGVKAAQETKSALVRVEESKVQAYESKKARRTNFLIIADVLSVFFGLVSVWIKATFRAAVGVHSVTQEKTVEAIIWAALTRWWNLFLGWLERLLGVDLDGNGAIGMAGSPATQTAPAKSRVKPGVVAGAVARNQIGFFGKGATGATIPATVDPQQLEIPVGNSASASQQNLIIGADGDEVARLKDAIYRVRQSISADETNKRKTEYAEKHPELKLPKAGIISTINGRLAQKRALMQTLEQQLQQAISQQDVISVKK